MRSIRTAALWIEAAICYGAPALLLLLGLPLLGIAVFSAHIAFEAGQSTGADALWILLLFAGGLAGLIGALNLTRRALSPTRRMAYPHFTLTLLCLGMFALAGALSSYDLNMKALLGPLAATMHFLYLARSDFEARASGSKPGDSEPQSAEPLSAKTLIGPLGVIALAVGCLAHRQSGITDPARAAAYAKTQEPDACMRWFRDGNSPSVIFRLDIREAQWPQLADVLQRFAREHQLEFHDGSAHFPDSGNVLQLSSCNDGGVTLMSSKSLWRLGPEWEWERDRGVDVLVYAALAQADWRSVADPLEAALQSTWPGAVVRQETDRQSSP